MRLFFTIQKCFWALLVLLLSVYININFASAYYWNNEVSEGFENKLDFSAEEFVEYDGKLFFSVRFYGASGLGNFRIMSFNGTDFVDESSDNFGVSNNTRVTGMGVYNDKLYAGTYNQNGFQIWEKDGADPWVLVRSGGGNDEASGFCTLNGNLYFGTFYPNNRAQVWQFDGTTWTRIDEGLFSSHEHKVNSCSVLDSKLYFSTHNNSNGTGIWEYDPSQPSGSKWTQINSPGFGDSSNYQSNLYVWNNQLYAGIYNYEDGGEMWVWDGADWSMLIETGHGDSANYYFGADMIDMNGKLYLSVRNLYDGGQIWEYDGSDFVQQNLNGFGNISNYAIWLAKYSGTPETLFGFTRNNYHGAEVWSTQFTGETNSAEVSDYVCLPTCNPGDGKMFRLSAFSNPKYRIQVSVARENNEFEIGIFDGDSGRTSLGNISVWSGNWDSTDYPLIYKLYRDPLSNGNNASEDLVATWHGNDSNIPGVEENWFSAEEFMPNNDWWVVTVPTEEEALSPSGTYFYNLEVEFDEDFGAPLLHRGSCFKIRGDNLLSIDPGIFLVMPALETFQDADFLYPYRYWNFDNTDPGPNTYDGIFRFHLDSLISKESVIVWDGDADFGSNINGTLDTDDPDTPPEIPDWIDSTGVVEEGAQGLGNPPDDSSDVLFSVPPSVRYTFYDSSGRSYENDNPSGGEEWEQFLITSDSEILSDHYVGDTFEPGVMVLELHGLDFHNLMGFRFQNSLLGVNMNGQAVEPLRPFIIGGTIWLDENENGVYDSDEPTIPGVFIDLYDSNGIYIESTVSDENGRYTFSVEGQTHDYAIDTMIYDGLYHVEIDAKNSEPSAVLSGLDLYAEPDFYAGPVIDSNVLSHDFGYLQPELSETGGPVYIHYIVGFGSIVLVNMLLQSSLLERKKL